MTNFIAKAFAFLTITCASSLVLLGFAVVIAASF
jgi:hypothetical protein